MDYQAYKQYSAVARGLEPADVVLKGAYILDVFTERWVPGDLALCDQIVVGIGSYEGKREIDCQGRYIVPGFVDSHLHLESTLVNPRELIYAASQNGTTTFIVDPHEAGNVAGLAGVQYILDATEKAQANVYVMAPSCVPALQGEKNGALLDADELAKLLENPRVLGLGEVMDCQAVIEGQPDMMKKLSLFQDRVMDGHIIGLSPQEVTAYALAGIKTNHEAMTYEEASQQVANGLYVLIRDGSAVHNVEAIVSGLVAHKAPLDRYAFCSDDKHIEDIQQEGHISANVRQAIELGLSPIQAFKMASIHACQCYGLSHLGALAPGYQADFLILDDIEKVSIEAVYVRGKSLHNEVLEIEEEDSQSVPKELLHTINMAPVTLQDLALPVEGLMPVINLVPGQITTIKSLETVPTQGGYFQAEGEFNKIACIERYEATGHCGVGIVKGFGIQGGAIATTFAHDSHNVVVIGDNDQDMLCAIERLKALGGGYVIASQGAIRAELPLEIMGLMTHCHHAVVDAKVKDMKALAYDMGVPRDLDPFINLSFLALPVIPEIRISPLGVVDVN